MPEVIMPGPEGRLEGRYHKSEDKNAPIAVVLHPHPLYGGTMNNKIVYNLCPRLDAKPTPGRPAMLDRRILFRSMDFAATADAPSGDHRYDRHFTAC